MEYQIDQYENLSREWQVRAEHALRAGNESMAREALGQKHQSELKAQSLQSQLVDMRASLTELYQALSESEVQAAQALSAQESLLARLRLAKSMQGVQRVQKLEGRVQKFERSPFVQHAADPLDARFRRLELDDRIEKQLAALRLAEGAYFDVDRAFVRMSRRMERDMNRMLRDLDRRFLM